VITCPACSKQNQDHYRFCLGCGAELPRGAAAKPDSTPPPAIAEEATSVGSPPAEAAEAPAAVEAPTAAEEPAAAEAPAEAAGPPGTCPECGHVNSPTNRFCATCGYRLDQVAPAAAAAPQATKVAEGAPAAVLIALDPEGNEVGRYSLPAGESTVGRSTGGIFASDAFLSPEHVRLVAADGKVRITDLGSLNGTYRKLIADQSEGIESGQRFRVGQELLQFDALAPDELDGDGVARQGSDLEGVIGTIALIVGRETAQPTHPFPERGLNLGRERGDVLFAEDGYVSGLHCQLSYEDGSVTVTDLGSSNGTFVQLLGEVELANGDMLLMGQQLFRVAI